jgi:50S ribosomal protein L16 3-hydroxylase
MSCEGGGRWPAPRPRCTLAYTQPCDLCVGRLWAVICFALSSSMKTEELFGSFGLARFITDHLHRLPLALPEVAQRLQAIGTWESLAATLAAPGVDVLVVRKGERHQCQIPTDSASAQSLCDIGCTIVIRHAERHDQHLAELAKAFEATFRAPVNIHMYATPPGCHGFSWHYDSEDVFIFQTSGRKEYLLRKNTVNPWPLEETIPDDMRYERELMPVMRVLLDAGDFLYVPCGYWHRAQTVDTAETAISLAVGIMSRSALDLFDLLRNELRHSLVWRQRLPVSGCSTPTSDGQISTEQRHLLAQLSADLNRMMADSKFITRALAELGKSPM